MIAILRILHPARLLWPIACIMAAAALWFLANREKVGEYIQERDKRNRYQAEVKALEEQQAALLSELAGLQAGGFAAEKAIRERFMMARPGEHILIIEEAPSSGEENAAIQGDSENESSLAPALPALPID